MKIPESPIERLFGPCDRRISLASHQSFGADTSGDFIVSVTPPRALRMPTSFVRLSCDETNGFLQWIRGEGTIDQCLPYITPSQREILLNGMDALRPSADELGDTP